MRSTYFRLRFSDLVCACRATRSNKQTINITNFDQLGSHNIFCLYISFSCNRNLKPHKKRWLPINIKWPQPVQKEKKNCMCLSNTNKLQNDDIEEIKINLFYLHRSTVYKTCITCWYPLLSKKIPYNFSILHEKQLLFLQKKHEILFYFFVFPPL